MKLLNMMFCFLLLFFGTTVMGQEVSNAPHTEWLSLLDDVTVMKQMDGAVVGQGVLCDYNSIQAAIDSGAQKVLVTNTGSPYLENIEFESRDIAIEGGYDNCLTAKEGKLGTEKSVIDGSALSAVISVVGQDPAEDVVMSFNNLVLRNGNAVNGGGLSFGASVYGMAQLDNMIIENNLANISGGGLYVDVNAKIKVWVEDSEINSNYSVGRGGGVDCNGGDSSILFNKNNQIKANTAATYTGGGLSTDSCSISVFTPFEMDANHAKTEGGALFAYFANTYFYGHQLCIKEGFCFGEGFLPIIVRNNVAGNDPGTGIGGGFSFGGNMVAHITNTEVSGNAASVGGAMALQDTVDVTVEGKAKLCRNRRGCNHYSKNHALTGGVFALSDEAKLSVVNTAIHHNQANRGVVVAHQLESSVYINPSELFMEGNLIHSNGLIDDLGLDLDNDELFLLDADSKTRINFTTIAHNAVSQSIFKDNGSQFYFMTSIVSEEVPIYSGFGSDDIGLDCLLVSENDSLPGGSGVLVGDPGFVKPENFDFHLTSGSPAIDYCDNWLVTPQYLDFDGSIRGFDYVPKANLYGPYDLGFDEFF